MFAATSLLILASLSTTVLAGQWHLADSHVGKDFLDAFVHQAIKDPTAGRVYVLQHIPLIDSARIDTVCSVGTTSTKRRRSRRT